MLRGVASVRVPTLGLYTKFMATCFVIQPFDKGKFDKRFTDVYEPAIKAAGYQPYRVDQDDKVTVPIESIEEGIRQSAVCLADITTDNPNVWYELGYAVASRRPVVMVCSEERVGGKFPFDIQHRAIVIYKTESASDFERLSSTITARIKANAEQGERLEQLAEAELISPVSGLSQPEFMLLAVLASGLPSPTAGEVLWVTKRNAEKAGITGMGFNLALRRLQSNGFVTTYEETDDRDGEVSTILQLTDKAWDWIDENDSKFVLHKPVEYAEMDDEIPF